MKTIWKLKYDNLVRNNSDNQLDCSSFKSFKIASECVITFQWIKCWEIKSKKRKITHLNAAPSESAGWLYMFTKTTYINYIVIYKRNIALNCNNLSILKTTKSRYLEPKQVTLTNAMSQPLVSPMRAQSSSCNKQYSCLNSRNMTWEKIRYTFTTPF